MLIVRGPLPGVIALRPMVVDYFLTHYPADEPPRGRPLITLGSMPQLAHADIERALVA